MNSADEHYLERELRERIQRDAAIFDFLRASSLDGFWYWDLENPENEWMDAGFWKTLGYDPADKRQLASEWKDLIHPEDLRMAEENFKAHCADPGHPYDQVVRYRHADGSTVWVRCRGIAIRDESGKPVRMLGAHNDITGWKKAEAELVFSAELYRGLGSALPMAVFHKDLEGRFRHVNQRFCEVIGREEKDIIGRSDFDLFDRRAAEQFRADDLRVIEAGELFHAVEQNPEPGSGVRYIEVFKNVVLRDGKPDGIQGVFWDVTERVAAEAELRESQELLHTLVENTPTAVAMFDEDMRYMAWSKRWLSDYRLGERDLSGLSHYEVFPEIGDEWKAIHQRCLAGATESREEDPFARADGSVDYVRWVVRPWHHNDGSVGGLIMFTEVVTERILTARALRESEDRFRNFMDASPLVAWIKDDEFKVRYVNQGWKKLFRLSAQESIGLNDYDFLPKEVADETRANDAKVLETGKMIETVERVPDADGRMRHWLVQKFPLRRAAQPTWVGGTAIDLTGRMEAEAEARLSNFGLERANVGFYLIGRDASFHRVNQAACQMLGYSREELGRLTVPDVDPGMPAEAWPEHWKELKEKGVIHFETNLRAKDGRVFPAEVEINFVEFEGVEYNFAFVRDISERVRAEKEREEMEIRFQEAQKLESLGVLAGGIAHDFNNLLTTMLGNVSLLKSELSVGSDHQESLNDVEAAAIRAADLCKQMLAYAGKGRFVLQQVDITELVKELLKLLKVSISKDAHLNLQLAENPRPILADAAQINQVVMNLVINASEALDGREGVITLATGSLRADADYLANNEFAVALTPGEYVFLEVGDNGPGMDEATRARIFDPFFTTKFTGRGLGLAAVQGIIRGHKGAMRVYSEPGFGTTFKILLPAADTESLAPAVPPSVEEEPPSSALILVIDDEESVRRTARRVLESAGHQVLLADDGVEGVATFTENRDEIRAVLLDLTMPRMDGVEAFRRLRQLRPGVPVLLMSGYNEQAAIQRFTGKGLAGFVQKPFLAEELLRHIREVLRDGPDETKG